MYERMLNKKVVPSQDEIYETIGTESIILFEKLQEFMKCSYELSTELRFPFGNSYGWGYKYSHRKKHICYTFFENGAFTVFIQIGKNELPKLYNVLRGLSQKAKDMWEQRYPCGEGGWLNYRVLNTEDLEDIKVLIAIKQNPILR